jgi:DEAD/DEAH box helicase domain-containing protein
MSVDGFLDHLTALPAYQGQIVHVEHLPAREARHGALDRPLHPALADALRRGGVTGLYSHQAAAVNAVRAGNSISVATSTASGKTLCYNIPVLESILSDRRARALYLFPTKALAQDQLRVLGDLTRENMPGLTCATFDGDTPQNRRPALRKSASIILTNPDMLSLGILPNHTAWAAFFAHLKYVVIDEAHVYRGVFGSQVANVLRRLRRVCAFYRRQPQFICCSATIANPGDHVQRLTGLPVTVVDDDGSPHGPRDFVLWNPPLVEGTDARRSANSEATLLLVELVKAGIRNITFTKARSTAELVFKHARDALRRDAPELAPLIAAYRAGYRPEDRRQIEQALFQGRLVGVAATTALELGVDIGKLDATVLTGYPGTLASTWQQAGRSGRGKDRALTFLIGMDNPLDQYLMRHPDEIFAKPVENALIDPDNPYILPPHMLSAAYEMPLSEADSDLFGGRACFEDNLAALELQGLISAAGGRWFYAGMGYPAQEINLRSASGHYFTILDRSRGSELLETIDPSLAFFQAYPGAIYLHQGDSYLVESMDLNTRIIHVRPVETDYYTQPMDLTDTRIIRQLRSRQFDLPLAAKPGQSADAPPQEGSGTAGAFWGQVGVTTRVIGFRRKQQFTEAVRSTEPLDLPPQSYEARGLWFDIPPQAASEISQRGLDLAGGLHALEHAAIGILPLFAMCDRNDIGGLSTPNHPDTGKAQIFIYDAYPGGVGISEKGYQVLPDLWQATLRLLQECPCEAGCPSCVHSPKCGNNNEPLDKQAAKVILEHLLDACRASGGGTS